LHHRDHRHVLTQTYNNRAEAHLSGGVLSPFVFLLIVAVVTSHMWRSAHVHTGPQQWCSQTL